eukprot:SAG31_NODE_5105_length_2741_cov_1.134746_4_plen_68_part_00
MGAPESVHLPISSSGADHRFLLVEAHCSKPREVSARWPNIGCGILSGKQAHNGTTVARCSSRDDFGP